MTSVAAPVPIAVGRWMIDEAARLDPIFKEIALKGERAGIFRIDEDLAGGEA